MKKILFLSALGGLLLFWAFWVGAEEKSRSPFLMPPDKVMAMKQMMMAMQPDTLEAGIERGKKLFNDDTLGDNTTRKSCASCHKDGGTSGGAAEMEWKGMKMKVNIPTLKGAAAHFPKPMGPMKAMVDLAGMNNMCIMTFLKGDPIDNNTQEAVDLVAYVTSLSAGKKLEPGAMKIVPKPVPGAM
ncbi:MAG: hypothetical protein HY267_04965 [Deltaproteobacteria bacterium]|nr:hypothetical protein [Deltaproteobacteria bacterium]